MNSDNNINTSFFDYDKLCNEYHLKKLTNLTNNKTDFLVNEKVDNIAHSIYFDLEKIIKLNGRDTVKDLINNISNVLEALDAANLEREKAVNENEYLKVDNENLLNQYEQGKLSKKATELVICYN